MRPARKRACAWLGLAVVALLVGCAEQSIRDAIGAINAEFQREYEKTVKENGTHVVSADPQDAYDAVLAALVKMGLVIKEQSRGLGVISAEAPAPTPLSKGEFDKCAAIDLPRARDIIRPYLGPLAESFKFDAKGLDTVMTATIIGTPAGSEISFTMRLREVGPPDTRFPRRDYPPPNVTRCGLDITWNAVNRELAAIQKSS